MVRFEKMSEEDFQEFLQPAIAEYAEEKVKAGTWAESEALQKSRDSFDGLLPSGMETQNQYLFVIIDSGSGNKVGYFWFQLIERLFGREAFIYDFKILEEFRGRSYGHQTMTAMDEMAKSMSIAKISLHVFAHNQIARKLYEKSGYHETDINMSKWIEFNQIDC